MVLYKLNPNTCSESFAIPSNWCNECPTTFGCAFSVAGDIADFQTVTVNGFSAEIAAGSATNEELASNVIAALVKVGMIDYNADDVTYDGTTLTFNAEHDAQPSFVIGGVKTDVTPLCTKVEYCEYEYNGAAGLEVTIDGIVAIEGTNYTYVDPLYTITAVKGSEVLVSGDPVAACLCGLYKFEA